MEVTQMVDIEIAVCCRKFINLELRFGKSLRLLGSLGAYTPYGYWLLLFKLLNMTESLVFL